MGLRDFATQAVRVLKLAKKPTRQELSQMIKITGLGMILLGIMGYIFQLIVYLLTLG